MAITRIIKPSITDDAVDNTKLDLASNYAFTGTITGTPNNLVQVSQVNISGSAYAHNSIFTSDYDTYFVTLDQIGFNTGDNHMHFKFYNDTGATSDNVYRGYTHRHTGAGNSSQSYHNAYPFLSISQNPTANMGLSGFIYVNNPVTSGVETTYWYQTAFRNNDGYSGVCAGGGIVTDFASRTHTGFYWFPSGNSFAGRAKVTVYGVKRT